MWFKSNDAGADYYAYKELFYSDVNAGIGAFYKIQIPNKNLKWETSGSLDIALEGRLFNRFNFSLDFFNKTSKDLLFTVYNPLSAGATDWFATSDETPSGMSQYFANIGSVRNTGLEVAMDVDAIRTKDWKWNIGLNLTTIHNEITKLPGQFRICQVVVLITTRPDISDKGMQLAFANLVPDETIK